jgi:hypothetical protein
MTQSFLPNSINIFQQYKSLGDHTIVRMPSDLMHWQSKEDFNSMAMIIKHLAGNMISRWTDFLTTDGEKPWRGRDNEFESNEETKEELILLWEKGWSCFMTTLTSLSADDLSKVILIRGEEHTVWEAIQRQMAHYPYHIGQMIFLSKMMTEHEWESLSIPKKK